MSTLRNRSPDAASKPTNELEKFVVPDLTIKDLMSAIPPHCFERSFLRSFSYIVADMGGLYIIYNTANYFTTLIPTLDLPYPEYSYPLVHFGLWSLYGFAAGLVATGVWVIAHECGHGAFCNSRIVNHIVGWILHSALGVPYHSWRISHARHHAHTSHLTMDQVFVPKTRSSHPVGLPALDTEKDDLYGAPSKVNETVQEELYEALGDSPIVTLLRTAAQLLFGWPLYLIINASGQKSYPPSANHFNPNGAPLFTPSQYWDVVISDIGVFFWLAGIFFWGYTRSWSEMLRVYGVPYLWVNHWLVLITFLQHTDPVLPHYKPSAFTFPRGALSTLNRNLMGGPGFLGKITGWIGATCTHGISETHVAHHVASKIPHYNAWEANDALCERLARAGYNHQGNPGTWSEAVRVFRECKFVEDEGEVVFYKNARGIAQRQAVFSSDGGISDSGVDLQ
jgi:omega-6 fatty acid desaturase (delta-12 desaturase)